MFQWNSENSAVPWIQWDKFLKLKSPFNYLFHFKYIFVIFLLVWILQNLFVRIFIFLFFHTLFIILFKKQFFKSLHKTILWRRRFFYLSRHKAYVIKNLPHICFRKSLNTSDPTHYVPNMEKQRFKTPFIAQIYQKMEF